jgi:hypothetical protein
VAELGQLQDHYHQNDNDQDPDDGPDDSSVHFASLDPRADPPLQIRSVKHSELPPLIASELPWVAPGLSVGLKVAPVGQLGSSSVTQAGDIVISDPPVRARSIGGLNWPEQSEGLTDRESEITT